MNNSIKTNFAAMTALQSLNMTNKNLQTTQSRVSTGYRVNEASDNAAYWAIATTLRNDNSALGTINDSLGLGAGQVDVAYTGVNQALDIARQIRDKLVSAANETVDRELVQQDIDQLQQQLLTVATGANYSGTNWLLDASTPATTGIVANYVVNASGSAVTQSIEVDLSQIRLFNSTDGTTGLLGSLYTISIGAATGSIDAEITTASTAIENLTTAATALGSYKSRIDLQQEFIGSLRDSIDRGVSSLVDADMNEESTRLQALQVQQQLGVQALSIANQSSQQILRLFQ